MRRTPWMLAALLGASTVANAVTITVNSTADTCSLFSMCLRRAIALANLTTDTDTIVFDIPGDPATPRRITLASPLYAAHPVIIDGYTQPGASPNTLTEGTNAQIRIVLDGSALGERAALMVREGPSDVRGLSIVGGYYGFSIPAGGAEVNLRGSFIGVEPDGTTATPNVWGVEIDGEFSRIGGADPADRNLISGNTRAGVLLYGRASIRNVVVGNLIGTDRYAEPVLGNGWSGVQVAGARLTRIGGYTAELQNVIAGNGDEGVYLIWGTDHSLYNVEVVSRIYGNRSPTYGAVDDGYPFDNDAGDADDGPNEALNHPVVTAATLDGGTLAIAGTLDTNPGRTYRVALFGNTRACNTPRGGEAERFIGYVTVAADAAGHADFRWSGAAPAAFVSVAAQAGTGQEDLYVDTTSRIGPCAPVIRDDRIFANGFQ